MLGWARAYVCRKMRVSSWGDAYRDLINLLFTTFSRKNRWQIMVWFRTVSIVEMHWTESCLIVVFEHKVRTCISATLYPHSSDPFICWEIDALTLFYHQYTFVHGSYKHNNIAGPMACRIISERIWSEQSGYQLSTMCLRCCWFRALPGNWVALLTQAQWDWRVPRQAEATYVSVKNYNLVIKSRKSRQAWPRWQKENPVWYVLYLSFVRTHTKFGIKNLWNRLCNWN